MSEAVDRVMALGNRRTRGLEFDSLALRAEPAGIALDDRSPMTTMGTAWGSSLPADCLPHQYARMLRRIIGVYDSPIIRAYCRVRFTIININILDILALCLRGKRRILDIGCGFGLFGCYFSALYPDIIYRGIDLNAKRIEMANRAASRLGLRNATFTRGDARDLELADPFDAIMMIDLLHHIDDSAKARLLETCAGQLADDGRLIIKDVTTRPRGGLAFTWGLDVLMTRGFDMWYWDEPTFHAALGKYFSRIDTFPIADWLPYPHIVYLSENPCPVLVPTADPVPVQAQRR